VDKVKVKKSAFDYLPWAGRFVDPVFDAELFAMLPGHVQREQLFVRKRFAEGNPCTTEEMIQAGKGDDIGKVEISLHSSLTLHSMASRVAGAPPTGNMAYELQAAVANEIIFEHTTCFGEGRRLLPAKPTHGFYAYLWALVLIQKKALKALPLPYYWELEEGLYELTGKKLNVRTPEAEPLIKWLDGQAENLASSVA
jgi:hypothetical protein